MPLDNIINKLLLLSFVFLLIVLSAAFAKHLVKRLQRLRTAGLRTTTWNKASGIIFGANRFGHIVQSPSTREGHIFVLGGSGSGKTSCLLIGSLLKFRGTYFCIDVSGDITKAVANEETLIFEPSSPTTVPYNVFDPIDNIKDPDEQNQQLEKLAYLIMPDTLGASDASHFFTTEGRKILTAALIAWYPSGMDFCDICHKIISSSYTDLFRAIDAQNIVLASTYIKSFRGASETNTGGCKQAVDAAVKLYALNQNIRNAVRRPNANQPAFSSQILETTNVIIRLEETLLDIYSPLLTILVSQTLTFFTNRPIGSSTPILFALDEFSSLGKMDILGALQRLRKRNVRIFVITQSLFDLDRIYGEIERKAMLNNFLYKAILNAGDTDTQEYFAKMVGRKTKTTYSKTTGNGSTSITTHQTETFAIEPDELSRLQKNLVLLHPAGHDVLQKAPYFKYEKKKRTKPATRR